MLEPSIHEMEESRCYANREPGAGGWAPVHSWEHREDALAGGLVDGFGSSYTSYMQNLRKYLSRRVYSNVTGFYLTGWYIPVRD